jgi:hypothetical protein
MSLRRIAVALLALVAPVMIVAGPVAAANYPPSPPANQTIVAPGVVYGGSAAGASTISVCNDAVSYAGKIQQGDPFLIKVCGFAPGSTVKVFVLPPRGHKTFVADQVADGDGALVAGPFRLTAPGRYLFFFAGPTGDLNGLAVGGGGGIGARGMSKAFAAPDRSVQVGLTVPVAGDGSLPRTGGDGGGHSAASVGFGLMLTGTLLILGVALRRRGRPRPRRARAAH